MSYYLKRISPVLMVTRIEPCLAFWEALGFDRTTDVPHGDHLGFVILEKNGLEVMYQTKDSVAGDVPSLAATPMGGRGGRGGRGTLSCLCSDSCR
jgi:hypothetical protein